MPVRDVIDLRVRSQPTERIPRSLVTFFDNHPEPCGVKDRRSRFLYANSAYKALLGLPDTFNVAGLSDGDLPSVTAFSFDIARHERLVEKEQRQISSLAICSFFKNKGIQAYFFDRMPSYNNKGRLTGTFFHGKEAKCLPVDFYTKPSSEYLNITTTVPKSPFTEREWDVIFLLNKGNSQKKISLLLELSLNYVKKVICRVLAKVDVYTSSQLIEYCEKRGWGNYIPQKFLFARYVILSKFEEKLIFASKKPYKGDF